MTQVETQNATKIEQPMEPFLKAKYDKAWEEIREGQLYYDYVWEFMEIVNNVTDFKMINPIMTPFDDEFKRADNETHLDDLQIFYGGDESSGHYTCTFYNALLNTVFVYDNTTELCERIKYLFALRYPKAEIHEVVPLTKQPDDDSCGIFSIAHATAIVFHHDPATVLLKIDHKLKNKTLSLREHLAKMLSQNRLEMFPSK